MLNVHAIKPDDLKALNADELAVMAAQMLAHIGEQSRHIGEQSKRIDTQAHAIKWRDAKIESITFQLARLKAWKFGARTERMNAEQRDIFEETLWRLTKPALRPIWPHCKTAPAQAALQPRNHHAANPSANHLQRICRA